MRVLFCTTPLDGHFRPLLPLAQSPRGARPRVAFATAASWHRVVEAEGFEALAAGADHTAARGVRLDAGWDAIQELPALDRRPYVFSYLFAQGHAPLKLPALLDAARAWRAQAIVYESGDLAAPVVAASLRLPSVNHAFGTMVSLSILERAAPAVAPLWRSAGLEPAPYAGAFEGLYVDVVPPLLADERPLCPSIRLRLADGEPVDPPPWLERLPRPLVYATMGTVFNRPASFAPLVDGLARAGVGALLTVGRNVDPSALGDVSPNVRVEQFVPQAQVLALLRGRGLARRLGHGARRPRRRAAARADPAGRRPVRECGPVRARGRRRCARPDEVTARRGRGRRAARALGAGVRRAAARDRGRVRGDGDADEVAAAVEEHVGAR